MKNSNKFILTIILLALVAVILLGISKNLSKSNIDITSLKIKSTTASEIPRCLASDSVFSEFHAGNSLEVFINKLSKPDTVLIDHDESCPIGQLHIWKNARKDYEIIVLGDDYTNTPNFKAKSRLFMIKRKENGINQPCYNYGIRLGDPYDSVLAKTNAISTPIERTGASLIDVWLFQKPISISIEIDGYFIDFVFVNKILQLIRISNFNVFEAC
jgi:hypothetical protein